MRFPLVSRRYAEYLEVELDRIRKERDEYRDQADRAKDELINRVGFTPVSSPVREEMKEAVKELEKYIDASQFEDTGSGMISEEMLKLADDIAGPSN